MTVYDLLNGGTQADPSAQLEGFRFGRPIVTFGPIPLDLYARIDEVTALDAAHPYKAETSASVDDLRYLWRRLGYAKEAGAGSRKAPLTWEDDASSLTDAELEYMRDVLECHFSPALMAAAA